MKPKISQKEEPKEKCVCSNYSADWVNNGWKCNNCGKINPCNIGGYGVNCCPNAPHDTPKGICKECQFEEGEHSQECSKYEETDFETKERLHIPQEVPKGYEKPVFEPKEKCEKCSYIHEKYNVDCPCECHKLKEKGVCCGQDLFFTIGIKAYCAVCGKIIIEDTRLPEPKEKDVEEWEKEFDKEIMCYCEEGKTSDHTTSNPEIIKDFIKQTFISKQDLIAEIEKLWKDVNGFNATQKEIGYNSAVNDIINIIKNK
jgi:hypothetical protein